MKSYSKKKTDKSPPTYLFLTKEVIGILFLTTLFYMQTFSYVKVGKRGKTRLQGDQPSAFS
ncbi:MAG: hypothetical protein GX667_08945 [Xanthomonadaceae bacterium]|nr:hypothetical protein [Xanthomonadaceae bacterium]